MDSSLFQEAVGHLRQRTLVGIPNRIAKLVFLGSSRDYNTGLYEHEGLAGRFTSEVAQTAMEYLHRCVFEELALLPIEELDREIDEFAHSRHIGASRFVRAWEELRPYWTLLPLNTNTVLGELFFTNVKFALEALGNRHRQSQPHQLSASQLL